jgi:hypothetical protein
MEFTLEVGRLEMSGRYPDSIDLHHSDATKSMLAKIERNLIARHDNSQEIQFEGTLENGYAK